MAQTVTDIRCIKVSQFNKDRIVQIRKIIQATIFNGNRFILQQMKTFRFLLDFVNVPEFLEFLHETTITCPVGYSLTKKAEANKSYHIDYETKRMLNDFALKFVAIQIDQTGENTLRLTWLPASIPYEYTFSLDVVIFLLIELAKVRIADMNIEDLEAEIAGILTRMD